MTAGIIEVAKTVERHRDEREAVRGFYFNSEKQLIQENKKYRMAEVDYQMALLLQHRFQQECRAMRDAEKSDQELARRLQEQFEHEEIIEKPSSSLVYAKQPKTAHNSSRSLVDPSWELVDPTPELLAVCVSWSKRMTTCAGICSYNGRGGMCCITLSAPLLKLRPRKDLVETLLHEMIHAFLFVTHNNRDRDGHGPEFHKHMYRINKEAGTNITVYHNFYDEVRLYQQHWWRCNGPCQDSKPYFGMVRRAHNRAPGPNDRWWAEHSRSCGGTFIKVREPVKKEKKVQAKTVTNVNSKDIRDFMVSNEKSSNSSNINGFKDLTNQVKGKFNSSSTIVVTNNTNASKENTFKPTILNAGTSSTVNKKTKTDISSTTSTEYTNDFMSVRSHWVNKFNNSQPKKRSAPTELQPSTSSKVQLVSERVPSADFCECPVCSRRMLISDLNSHLDVCLNEPSKPANPDILELPEAAKSTAPEILEVPEEEKKECPLCYTKVPSSTFDTHVEKCLIKVYDEVEEKFDDQAVPETFSCLVCGKKITKTELNSHLDDCMVNIFGTDMEEKTEEVETKPKVEDDAEKPTSSQFNCPFCMKLVEEIQMKDHLDVCLNVDNDGLLDSLMVDTF